MVGACVRPAGLTVGRRPRRSRLTSLLGEQCATRQLPPGQLASAFASLARLGHDCGVLGDALLHAAPRMDLASLERKLKLIRDIQKARVEAHPGGGYLETTPFLLNTDGELRVYGEVRGKRKTLRADDGIHFTMAGSTFLADAVVGPVLEAFGYEPPEPPTAEDGAGAGSEDG